MLGINARRALKNLHTNKFSWTDKSSLTGYIIICSSSTIANIWTTVQKIQPVFVKNACLSKRMYNYVQQLASTFLCHIHWKKQHATGKSSLKVKPTTLAQKLHEQPKIWHTVTCIHSQKRTFLHPMTMNFSTDLDLWTRPRKCQACQIPKSKVI